MQDPGPEGSGMPYHRTLQKKKKLSKCCMVLFVRVYELICSILTIRHTPVHPQIQISTICYTPGPLHAVTTCRLLKSEVSYVSVIFCFFTDATVHPPASDKHPYENQDPASLPPDVGYGCKMVNGVMHVYTTRDIMEKYVAFDISFDFIFGFKSCLSSDFVHTFHWQQPLLFVTGAQSWTCRTQTCRSTLLT